MLRDFCRRCGCVSVFILMTAWLGAAEASSELPIIELSTGIYRIKAEVAATPESRAKGLMHRESMASNQGMLFVFTELNTHCMWMRNTLLPLSVAFLDEGGRILNIAEMAPKTETNHCAVRPSRFALEMNSAWFSQRGIKEGAKVLGLERSPSPR